MPDPDPLTTDPNTGIVSDHKKKVYRLWKIRKIKENPEYFNQVRERQKAYEIEKRNKSHASPRSPRFIGAKLPNEKEFLQIKSNCLVCCGSKMCKEHESLYNLLMERGKIWV